MKPSLGRGGATGLAAGETTGMLSFISSLPRVEIDAGVDPRVGEVRDQVHGEADEREDVQVGEHDRIVAVHDGFEREQPEPIEGKDRLDEKRAREEGADESSGEARD